MFKKKPIVSNDVCSYTGLGVCVCLLKRSKTCTWSLRFPHEEPMIAFGESIYHEEFFYIYIYIYLFIYINISMRFHSIYLTLMYSLHKARALGLPWQTQCNEAMPWRGKHDLISHVYLHNNLIYMVINKCLINLLVFLFQAEGLHLQRNIFFHDFST